MKCVIVFITEFFHESMKEGCKYCIINQKSMYTFEMFVCKSMNICKICMGYKCILSDG